MWRGFLSYSRANNDLVECLVKHLQPMEPYITFWYDKDKLEPGDNFETEIITSIGISDIFLFLVTPDYFRKDGYAKKELSLAKKSASNNSKSIIPAYALYVSLSASGVSKLHAIPPSHWLDPGHSKSDLERWCEDVVKALSRFLENKEPKQFHNENIQSLLDQLIALVSETNPFELGLPDAKIMEVNDYLDSLTAALEGPQFDFYPQTEIALSAFTKLVETHSISDVQPIKDILTLGTKILDLCEELNYPWPDNFSPSNQRKYTSFKTKELSYSLGQLRTQVAYVDGQVNYIKQMGTDEGERRYKFISSSISTQKLIVANDEIQIDALEEVDKYAVRTVSGLSRSSPVSHNNNMHPTVVEETNQLKDKIFVLRSHIQSFTRPHKKNKTVNKSAPKKRIFISRTGTDIDASSWMAVELEKAGFECIVQQRDFELGTPSPQDMREKIQTCDAFVCLMSPDYWASHHCMKEWDAAYGLHQRDAGKVIPVMVKTCTLPRLDNKLAYLNLVNAEPESRGTVLVDAVEGVIFRNKTLPSEIKPEFVPLFNDGFYTPNFTGREDELIAIEKAFWESGEDTAPKAVVLQGLGGNGKSAIAREYVRTNLHRYAAAWHVRAEDSTSLKNDLADFAKTCSQRYDELTDADQLIRAAVSEADTLARQQSLPVIFLLDNVEHAGVIPKLLRRDTIHLLITSRYSNFEGDFVPVRIDSLASENAKRLLLQSSAREIGVGLDELMTALGNLPLAIIQAAAYLRENPEESFKEYLTALERRINEASTDWDPDERLVNATFAPSIALAEASAPGARDMLNYAAFFAADGIPFEVLARLFGDDVEAAKKSSSKLQLYSLWQVGADSALGPTRHMHRLLQAVLRRNLDEVTRVDLAKTAAEQVMMPYPGDPHTDLSSWPKWQEILPQALALSGNDRTPESPELATLLSNCGVFSQFVTSDFSTAEALFRRALKITEQSYGPDHPNVATGLNNLAELLRATNRLDEAEHLYRRALEIDEASHGPDHPNVAIRLNNLAGLLRATNRFDEAEPLYRQALKIDEASHGTDHPNFAVGLNNLAELLRATNRLDEAEPVIRRALSIDEASYGPDHPTVAVGLNNLAELLRATNRLDEAEPLYRRALSIDETSYGPNHPSVATSLNNLAELLRATNRRDEAEPIIRRALKIDEASYGPDHPLVATRLNNLANLLARSERLAEALPLMQRAKRIFDAGLPDGHPNREGAALSLQMMEHAHSLGMTDMAQLEV